MLFLCVIMATKKTNTRSKQGKPEPAIGENSTESGTELFFETKSLPDDVMPSDLNSNIIAAIRIAVRQVLQEDRASINNNLATIAQQLKNLNDKYEVIESAIADCSARIDQTLTEFIPKLNAKAVELSSSLAIRLLDIDVHRRKWSLVLQGLPGESGENADVTRVKCVQLAKTHLGVPDASTADMAACHRLNNSANAAILLHFVDLDKRNRWLSGAKGLSSHAGKLSLSPDLPPVTRPLKQEILKKRQELDTETKKVASVRYLKTFPYIQLNIRGRSPIMPGVSKEKLMESYLNVSPYIDMTLSKV